MGDFKIEDQQEIYLNGRAVTTFKLFKKGDDIYTYAGTFSAPGHSLSDRACFLKREC